MKSYNPDNQIIFIGDLNIRSDKIKIYNVEVDKGDIVSRSPIYNNVELYPIMKKYRIENQDYNKARYMLKQKKKQFYYKTFFEICCDIQQFKRYIIILSRMMSYDIEGK
ncbi:hypothetical protein EFR42_08575 [Lactobacillus delbrueckii]|nr:hypothetical protein [Lactobacillus delbrueckii]MCT3492526.1 hypothetical protein [Lactobacillus delbrueckii]